MLSSSSEDDMSLSSGSIPNGSSSAATDHGGNSSTPNVKIVPHYTPPTLDGLVPELLRSILDFLDDDTEKLVSLDRRAYLSQESFSAPSKPTEDIGNFRLTCKKFSEVGAKHQFARVTTRFSEQGFRRLENIARCRHLASNVKKFSYMVPFFYEKGRDRVSDINPNQGLSPDEISNFEVKRKEQKSIVETDQDLRVLTVALEAFSSLQHVQVLPIQDQLDAKLIHYLRIHHDLEAIVDLRWAPACLRSTKTIGEALLVSKSPCTRFSSPMLSPSSARLLGASPPQGMALPQLASRLTCLELHFEDGSDLEMHISDLIGLFEALFSSADNLEAVHVGFPSHRPLSLPLEDIFHHKKWEKLKAFGIQGWKLDAQEIIDIATRHREKLVGLRLREVLLKEGSMWKDVLYFLRTKMPKLDWVSLRRIGYAQEFDERWAHIGLEVSQDDFISDSDDEDIDDTYYDHEDSVQADPSDHSDHESLGSFSSDGEHSHNEDEDDEDRIEANGMGFPSFSDAPREQSWCNCNGDEISPDNLDALGDGGKWVTNATRKLWEQWVVRKCPEHG